MARKATDEQIAVVDAVKSGCQVLAIGAYAGTGKTTTMVDVAGALNGARVGYIAYNRAARVAATPKFGQTASCHTMHSLAYDNKYRGRLNGPRQRGNEQARNMRLSGPTRLAEKVLSPAQLAVTVMATLRRFSHSAAERVQPWHVPTDMNGLSDADIEALKTIVPPLAQRAWDQDITQPHGVLPFDHDFYLKIFALSHPKLSQFDVMLLDEAQDTNGCWAALMEEQAHAQRVYVGDAFQELYGWRGASNFLDKVDAIQRLHLTQSFRFGDAVADAANVWLGLLGAQAPLRGFGKIQSRVEACPNARAVLCRTNAEAIGQLVHVLDAGRTAAIAGGVSELMSLTIGAIALQAGRPAECRDLMGFTTWGEVQDLVENDPGASDLKVFVKLVDEHTGEGLMDLLRRVTRDESRAHTVISTVHKAKGLEWDTVRLGRDFRKPKDDAPMAAEMGRIFYVATTRAISVLDDSTTDWAPEWIAEGGRITGARMAPWAAAMLNPVAAPASPAPAATAPATA